MIWLLPWCASPVWVWASTLRQPAPEALVATGDIAECGSPRSEDTAKLLDHISGTVLVLGDAVYEGGTADEFATCYDPSWGRHKERTRPVPGNHEYYGTGDLRGYFGYFGLQAPSDFYSYNLGAWHIVALNSNCDRLDCGSGSPQAQWLRADLVAHPSTCILAYMHHPRFSSGPVLGEPSLEVLWWILYEAGADVLLTGHGHLYERFAPQDPAGMADPVRGIRQFTVGTGGAQLARNWRV